MHYISLPPSPAGASPNTAYQHRHAQLHTLQANHQTHTYTHTHTHVALQKLPPALVMCGEVDILRDQSKAYADKLSAAGVEAEWVEAKV